MDKSRKLKKKKLVSLLIFVSSLLLASCVSNTLTPVELDNFERLVSPPWQEEAEKFRDNQPDYAMEVFETIIELEHTLAIQSIE